MDGDGAVAAVAAADPLMGAFISRAGPFEPRAGAGDYFASLARAILYQQLAGRAAAAIHARFVQAIGGEVTPRAVLNTSPETPRELRQEGERFRPFRSVAAWYCWRAVSLLRGDMVLPQAAEP